ncbi:hypothetical protein L7F22_015961 [Adiantum nelumboides]|nr:hypothetical protein [Adiantum nelumboides]
MKTINQHVSCYDVYNESSERWQFVESAVSCLASFPFFPLNVSISTSCVLFTLPRNMLRLLRRRQNVQPLLRLSQSGAPSAQCVGDCSLLPHSAGVHSEDHRNQGHTRELHVLAAHTQGVSPSAMRPGIHSLGIQCSPSYQNHQRQQERGAHTPGVYVHHTTGLTGDSSMAVTIGFFHALRSAHRGLGFFTPIEVTSSPNSLSRFQVMKNVFKLQDSDESMRGVTHTQAFELIECNKMDELLEEVLKGMSSIDSKSST